MSFCCFGVCSLPFTVSLLTCLGVLIRSHPLSKFQRMFLLLFPSVNDSCLSLVLGHHWTGMGMHLDLTLDCLLWHRIISNPNELFFPSY